MQHRTGTVTAANGPVATERPGAGTEPIELRDSASSRVRRSLDLVRLSGLLLAVLVLVGLGLIARDTSRGINSDLARLVSDVPHVLLRSVSLLAAFGALALPLAFMVRDIVRGQTRRLIEAVLTGLLSIGVVAALNELLDAFPASQLHVALVRVGSSGSVRPLDTYLAALLAFTTVLGLADVVWRGLLASVIALYVLSVFTATQASLLSLALSLVVGATIGITVRYSAGSVNERPDAAQLAASLAERGIELASLLRIESTLDGRSYEATTRGGHLLRVQVLDRDLLASGAVYNLYRLIRIRTDLAPAPALSLERVAEHRSLLAMAASAAGVPVPRLIAGVRCGPDTIVLVYEWRETTALTDPTPAQLDELWRAVTLLHRNRVTHRGLTPGQIRLGVDGDVLLPIPEDGAAFANDLRISLDRVQLLITTAQWAGAEQAVRSARHVLTDEELAATVPVLQPIALSRQTREALRQDSALLEAVRDQVQAQTNQPAPDLARVERVRPRTIISIAAVIVAGYLIVGQLGTVDLVTVLSGARWQWVPLVLAASAATYVAAALSLTGYVRERLPFARTVLVQLAASFAGFVTPPSVGGLALNIRYLRKSNVSTAGAATSVGLSQVVNGVSHVVLLIAFATATGEPAHHSVPIPGWAFVALGALAALMLLALALPAVRRWLLGWLLPPLREAVPRLLNLLTNPAKLAEGVVGALLLNGCYIAALWFSVHAFDGRVGVAQVAVVYLAGAAIGSVAPTPGGLGAVEIALSTGLAAAGMASAAAISAVLLFRLATFWLPVPLGWVALRWLQRREAL